MSHSRSTERGPTVLQAGMSLWVRNLFWDNQKSTLDPKRVFEQQKSILRFQSCSSQVSKKACFRWDCQKSTLDPKRVAPPGRPLNSKSQFPSVEEQRVVASGCGVVELRFGGFEICFWDCRKLILGSRFFIVSGSAMSHTPSSLRALYGHRTCCRGV